MCFVGVGAPAIAHHFEKKIVARKEGLGVAQAGSIEVADWDAGWETDEKEEPEIEVTPGVNPASVEEEPRTSGSSIPRTGTSDDDDDAADAWGWGDDDATDAPVPEPKSVGYTRPPAPPGNGPEIREMTLSEPYWTSAIPKPVFDTISVIYNDGAELTKTECVLYLAVCTLTNFS